MTREESKPHSNAARPVVFGILVTMLALLVEGCTQSQSAPVSVSAAPPPEPFENPVPRSKWTIIKSRSDLTGETRVTAINDASRDVSLILRLRGRKFDCYIRTGEFLETVENMHSRSSVVKYKFDEGGIVRQAWTISDDNTALFYPGNTTAFIQKLRKAKRFVIEYSPADVIPKTASFDVSLFPSEIAYAVGLP